MMDTENHVDRFDEARRPTIASTLELIERLHVGQTDLQRQPYYQHPVRVAMNLLDIFPLASKDMIMAALLHDVVEDCEGVDIEYLRRLGYSDETLDIVEVLTRDPDDPRPYQDFIDDIIASGNKRAMLVKIADNMDNLHPERALRAERYTESIQKLAKAAGWNEDYIFNAISTAKPLTVLNAEDDWDWLDERAY